jgi:hypothetical protein
MSQRRVIYANTSAGVHYPAYVNVTMLEDGRVQITGREPPDGEREGKSVQFTLSWEMYQDMARAVFQHACAG